MTSSCQTDLYVNMHCLWINSTVCHCLSPRCFSHLLSISTLVGFGVGARVFEGAHTKKVTRGFLKMQRFHASNNSRGRNQQLLQTLMSVSMLGTHPWKLSQCSVLIPLPTQRFQKADRQVFNFADSCFLCNTTCVFTTFIVLYIDRRIYSFITHKEPLQHIEHDIATSTASHSGVSGISHVIFQAVCIW